MKYFFLKKRSNVLRFHSCYKFSLWWSVQPSGHSVLLLLNYSSRNSSQFRTEHGNPSLIISLFKLKLVLTRSLVPICPTSEHGTLHVTFWWNILKSNSIRMEMFMQWIASLLSFFFICRRYSSRTCRRIRCVWRRKWSGFRAKWEVCDCGFRT